MVGVDVCVCIEQLQDLVYCVGQFLLMEYGFLFYWICNLLLIGYNVDDYCFDNSFYDLLVFEVWLCVFVVIVQGQLVQESWFVFGWMFIEVNGMFMLLLWSGLMFEYFMLQLVMLSYLDMLFDQMMWYVVEVQIVYGCILNLLWGVFELGYNVVDVCLNYQYCVFGVLGLGFKCGLGQDWVIVFYVSMMVLMVVLEVVCQNLQVLDVLGFFGCFGMYEVIDYMFVWVLLGQDYVLLCLFMVYYQGMGLLLLDYLLCDQLMQCCFVVDVEFQVILLLLQECILCIGVFYLYEVEVLGEYFVLVEYEMVLCVLCDLGGLCLEVQLLFNGCYYGMLIYVGGGYSCYGDLLFICWCEDGIIDVWGIFCYLCDVDSGEFWLVVYQFICVLMDNYEVIFFDVKVEFCGVCCSCESYLQVVIFVEDDIEFRCLCLINCSCCLCMVEIIIYVEVVLVFVVFDDVYLVFSNFFVQSEILVVKQVVLCIC